MTHTINSVEANRLQKLWMDADCSAMSKDQQNALCKLYERVPTSYISCNDHGQCAVFVQSQPISYGKLSLAEGEALAVKHGVQTSLRWNSKGFWFDAYDRFGAPARVMSPSVKGTSHAGIPA